MSVKFLNARGFTLPEIAVALGLMGGISLVTMKLVDEQASNQALITANAEVQSTVSIIQQALKNPETCRKMIGNVTKGTSISPLYYTFEDSHNPTGADISKELLRANTKYDKFRVETITFKDATPAAANSAVLEIVFRINNKSMTSWGPDNDANDKSIVKTLPLIVKMDTSNRLADCGPATSETNDAARQKFCSTMGGAAVWDAATKTCKLTDKMSCPSGQIPQTLTSLGYARCVPIPMDKVFDTGTCTNTSNNQFTIVTGADGRLRVQCL